MLWVLAGVSVALLIYEAWALAAGVLLPLLANPNALQTDFHYYYEAAVRFRADPPQLYRLSDDVIAGFAYPPPAILPFAALSFVPLGMAMLLWTVASYAAVVVAIAIWIRSLAARGLPVDGRTAAAMGLIALALGPTYSNAVFGQVNAFVLLSAVAFVVLGPVTGGASLAGGVWLKIYPALMVVTLVWDRGAWRKIAYAAVAALAIFVITLPRFSPSTYRTYVGEVLTMRADKTAIHITNQSAVAFAERFSRPPEKFLNWTGEQAVTVTARARVFSWAVGAGVLWLMWNRARRGTGPDLMTAAAGVMALAAVIAPLGWGHTFILVVPLVLLHLAAFPAVPPWRAAVVCIAVAAMMIPAGRRFGIVEQLMPWMQNVFYSRYLLATLVLIALPVFKGSKG